MTDRTYDGNLIQNIASTVDKYQHNTGNIANRKWPDYATDVYLIERQRKFEIDKLEQERAAVRALLSGAWNGLWMTAIVVGVVGAIVWIVKG